MSVDPELYGLERILKHSFLSVILFEPFSYLSFLYLPKLLPSYYLLLLHSAYLFRSLQLVNYNSLLLSFRKKTTINYFHNFLSTTFSSTFYNLLSSLLSNHFFQSSSLSALLLNDLPFINSPRLSSTLPQLQQPLLAFIFIIIVYSLKPLSNLERRSHLLPTPELSPLELPRRTLSSRRSLRTSELVS